MLTRKAERGFNMVEAMVTVAVLALLIALMVPNISEWLRSTQVRALAEGIQNGLQKTRMEALRRNKAVTFWMVSPGTSSTLDNTCTLSSTAGSWIISVEDPTSKCGNDPSPTVSPMIFESFNAGASAASMTIAGLAADGTTAANSATFNGFGQSVAGGIALINVSHSLSGARRLRIAVSVTGSVRMCDLDVNATDARACPP